MTEANLVVLVGSLRSGSVNAATARAAIGTAEPTTNVTAYDLLELPFYNGDVEAAGIPPVVQGLHDAVEAADGILVFSPEYNSSFPAVTKNAIDWMSRPPKAWEDKAMSLVVTTPGPRAGLGIRTHFEAIMAHQPIRLFKSLGIGTYGDKLDEAGDMVDPVTLDELRSHLAAFAAFCVAEP